MTDSAPQPPSGALTLGGDMTWLRWLLVLPVAILAGVCVLFPLHWVLYATLSHYVEPYPQLPERVLGPFATALAFVWSGSRVAPKYRVETAVALFVLWVFVLGGFVFLAASGAEWMGQSLSLQGGGLAPAMAGLGALGGLLIARRRNGSATGTSPHREP